MVAEWIVLECKAGRLWTIDAVTREGDARLTYVLAARGRASEFKRVLQYRSRGLPWRWLDGNITRRVLRRQARMALRKRVLGDRRARGRDRDRQSNHKQESMRHPPNLLLRLRRMFQEL